MNVLSILDAIANDASKNNKIAILKQHKDNIDLMTAILLAYNPTINFYQKKIPAYTPADTPILTLLEALSLLHKLSSREVTGAQAVTTLLTILQGCNKNNAEVVARVVARDLRSGFSSSTANKVWANLIPTYPYMRCALPKAVKIEDLSWETGVYSQLKADGMFANVNVGADGSIHIASRNGTEFPLTEFGELIAEAQRILTEGMQHHGELLIKRNGVVLPREIGNGILNKVAKGGQLDKGDVISYLVWDAIPLASVVAKGSNSTPYETRFAQLKNCAQSTLIELIPTKIVHNMPAALAHYRTMLAAGLEGTIIKDAHAIWKDGTSKQQIKMKLEVVVDLELVGFNEGKGKNENTFGSVFCRSSDSLLEVGVSGFADEMRQWIHSHRDDLIGTIMSVKSNSIMPPSGNNKLHSLFLPVFVEFRQDKTTADSLDSVLAQFANAIK